MTNPPPSLELLTDMVCYARRRGLPEQVAEDVVFECWQKAAERFDPDKGSIEALMQTILRNRCAYWWRQQAREARIQQAVVHLQPTADTSAEERADRRQQRFLEALQPTEREVFATWALQKSLGKGRVSSEQMGASIGMAKRDYENAKRRLRGRLQALLDEFGWTVRELLFGADDVERSE